MTLPSALVIVIVRVGAVILDTAKTVGPLVLQPMNSLDQDDPEFVAPG